MKLSSESDVSVRRIELSIDLLVEKKKKSIQESENILDQSHIEPSATGTVSLYFWLLVISFLQVTDVEKNMFCACKHK